MNILRLKSICLILIMTMISIGVQAHALWIHTASNAEKGKPHPFKIYYAGATHTEKLPENDPSGLEAIWKCATQAITVE